MPFKDFVKECRKQTGLTQVKFADLVNVSVDTLRSWEQGTRTKLPHEAMIRDHIKRIAQEVTE